MIVYVYQPALVVLSVVIALMSSFTGLSLTRGLSGLPVGLRQVRIAMAAVALGGGIWSMHFVAMLAMRFNVPVYYEVIETVASALIAILLSGLSLLILHFLRRTRGAILLSGAILGIGIAVMHHVGLLAIEGCLPVFDPFGVALSGVLSVGFGIGAIAIAYGHRSQRNILLATLVFGIAVAVVHFVGMAFTSFAVAGGVDPVAPVLANAQIAIVVLLAAFAISGAFLLTGASVVSGQTAPGLLVDTVLRGAPVDWQTAYPAPPPQVPPPAPAVPRADPALRLPFERDGRTHLVPFDAVCAIRADGHYTTAFLDQGPVFCPWSITVAEARLPPGFMRVHRSWLVNLSQVSGFDRAKDHGYCMIGTAPGLDRVPVSRARIAALREALGL